MSILRILSLIHLNDQTVKTSTDPRHLKRRKTIKELFAHSYTVNKMSHLTKDIVDHLNDIDAKIQDAAPAWTISKLNRVDLAILRLAVYELLYETKTPPKVTIDEAVELAKEYGADSSPSFVNGVLGTVLENEKNK